MEICSTQGFSTLNVLLRRRPSSASGSDDDPAAQLTKYGELTAYYTFARDQIVKRKARSAYNLAEAGSFIPSPRKRECRSLWPSAPYTNCLIMHQESSNFVRRTAGMVFSSQVVLVVLVRTIATGMICKLDSLGNAGARAHNGRYLSYFQLDVQRAQYPATAESSGVQF